MTFLYFGCLALGYLLGSIPFGYLIARRHGIDIRQHGSGNIGATNVVRVLGKKPGYTVFFCDAMKGLAAALLATAWAHRSIRSGAELLQRFPTPAGPIDSGTHDINLALANADARFAAVVALAGIIAGLACILGHNFPVWLQFKGGKGVATTIGVLLGLMPAAVAVAVVVWAIAFYASRYVSLASLTAAAVLPAAVWALGRHADAAGSGFGPLFWFSVAAAGLIFWRHRSNITRLLNGTESRFARPAKVQPSPPSKP